MRDPGGTEQKRTREAAPQVLLYRIHRVPVGACQPVTEVTRRLVRRLAIEGHERGWHARSPYDVRAPSLLRDGSDLDQIRTAADDLLETVKDWVQLNTRMESV